MNWSASRLRCLGRAIRTLLALVYAGGVVLGFCTLSREDVDLRYVALRDLPVGHQLKADDLTVEASVPSCNRHLLPERSDPVGKYLFNHLSPGQTFGISDLSATPVLTFNAGEVKYYFFPLQNQMYLAEVLNTGSRVAVCATTCPAENVRVASIVCDATLSPKCSAVLELSKDQIAAISAGNTTDYRLFRQSN
jgi:hypothetical protein